MIGWLKVSQTKGLGVKANSYPEDQRIGYEIQTNKGHDISLLKLLNDL